VRLRLTVTEIDGHWDFDLPEDHPFVQHACEQRDLSGAAGWDAVATFQNALGDCVAENVGIEVIPNAEHEPRAVASRAPCSCSASNNEGGK
jgi:hypothetical protein